MTLSQHVLPNMKLIMTKCIVSCPFQTQQQRNATASLAGAAHNWLEPVFYVYFKRVNVMLQLLAGVLVAPWTIVVTYIYQSINSLVPLSNTTNNRLLTLATNLSESGECWLHDLDHADEPAATEECDTFSKWAVIKIWQYKRFFRLMTFVLYVTFRAS